MNAAMAVDLQNCVELQHGGHAVFHSVEPHNGQPVWQGEVHVFYLEDHPKATRVYAWSSLVEGSDRRRFNVVLHLGGIRSARDAVRAAIVAEQRR